MKRAKYFLMLIATMGLASAALGQVSSLVYVDVSQQNERAKIMGYVDSVLAQDTDKPLVFVSNGGRPGIYIGRNAGDCGAAIRSLNPNLPTPYFDVDTLISITHRNGGTENLSSVYFFLSEAQVSGTEKHMENLVEKYLLSMGMISAGEIIDPLRVYVFQNSESSTFENQNNQDPFIRGMEVKKY